jgi:hypothetical protein
MQILSDDDLMIQHSEDEDESQQDAKGPDEWALIPPSPALEGEAEDESEGASFDLDATKDFTSDLSSKPTETSEMVNLNSTLKVVDVSTIQGPTGAINISISNIDEGCEEEEEEHASLNVDSVDSFPTQFDTSDLDNISVKTIEEKKEADVTTNSDGQTKEDGYFVSLRIMRIFGFTILTLSYLLVRATHSLHVTQTTLLQVQQEIHLLKKELHNRENEQMPYNKWLKHGSENIKEWISSLSDASPKDYSFLKTGDSDNTFLDIWPTQAYEVMQNATSLLGETIDEVGESFSTVGETVNSVGLTVKDKLTTVSQSMLDIVNHHKYTLLVFGIYKIYDDYYQN